MNVLITGAAGFLGQRLARALLQRAELVGPSGVPEPIDRIVLSDVVAATAIDDSRISQVVGDLGQPQLLARALDAQTHTVFHLAAVVSGQAEAEFELGLRVNFDATRALLERCRTLGHQPRVLLTSSVAVYGGPTPEGGVGDDTALTPQSSYGTQKAMAELLLADVHRKGFVDGRCLRLPTVSVRTGQPNLAASSFASGIIREPLSGQECRVPVRPSTELWLLSPQRAIENLICGHELDSAALGLRRSVNLPGLRVSVAEMVDALQRVAGTDPLKYLNWQHDDAIERIIASWPPGWDSSRALALGFAGDTSFDDIVRAHIAERRSVPV